MKKILLFFLPIYILYGQQQVKPEWPSLARSAWPVLRGDFQSTGRSEFRGPSTCNFIWKKDIPDGINRGPVIGHKNSLYSGTDVRNDLYSIDGNNGAINWVRQFPLFGSPAYTRGAPILTNDSMIYIFSGNQHLYKMTFNGDIKWDLLLYSNSHVQTPMDKEGKLFISRFNDTLTIINPTGVIENKIYLPGISFQNSFSFGGDTLFCLFLGNIITNYRPAYVAALSKSGQKYWEYHFPYVDLDRDDPFPLVDNNNRVYVYGKDSSLNSHLYSINPDGTLNWRYDFGGYGTPSMDKFGNILFCAIKNINNSVRFYLTSLDYSGNLNWEKELLSPDDVPIAGLVVDNEGKIYGGGTYPGSHFYCLDKEGNFLWTATFGSYEYDSAPAIGEDGTLYLGYHSNGVLCVQNLIAINDTMVSGLNNDLSSLEFSVSQNYPNPFNPTTQIKYSLAHPSMVSIKIYNVLGKEVASLVNEEKPAGEYTVTFNGSSLSSGVYFYTLRSGAFTETKKFVLLK